MLAGFGLANYVWKLREIRTVVQLLPTHLVVSLLDGLDRAAADRAAGRRGDGLQLVGLPSHGASIDAGRLSEVMN